jgi:hypothetical protein
MVDGPSDTLYLTVSTLNLSTAIIELSNSGGKVLYPAAWHVLTTESERRQAAQGGAASFGIAREKFEELPATVRAFLQPT